MLGPVVEGRGARPLQNLETLGSEKSTIRLLNKGIWQALYHLSSSHSPLNARFLVSIDMQMALWSQQFVGGLWKGGLDQSREPRNFYPWRKAVWFLSWNLYWKEKSTKWKLPLLATQVLLTLILLISVYILSEILKESIELGIVLFPVYFCDSTLTVLLD